MNCINKKTPLKLVITVGVLTCGALAYFAHWSNEEFNPKLKTEWALRVALGELRSAVHAAQAVPSESEETLESFAKRWMDGGGKGLQNDYHFGLTSIEVEPKEKFKTRLRDLDFTGSPPIEHTISVYLSVRGEMFRVTRATETTN
jgi:hypothetical protein